MLYYSMNMTALATDYYSGNSGWNWGYNPVWNWNSCNNCNYYYYPNNYLNSYNYTYPHMTFFSLG